MSIDRLLEIMRQLRDPKRGCPWDLEQDFSTIAPHTLEEAYEVTDAIERGDMPGLQDELGDLLFQVVFHARLAEEQGLFDFDGVARSICDKLERRHPHVFGDAVIADAEEQTEAWERYKADERKSAGKGAGALAGVPVGLPALTRAAKLGKRAAQVGFDWPEAAGARAKISEELGELDQAVADPLDVAGKQGELGDLLFAVVNYARHLGIDPETALRESNQRFASRFAEVERRLAADGQTPQQASLDSLEAHWQAAKATLKAGQGS